MSSYHMTTCQPSDLYVQIVDKDSKPTNKYVLRIFQANGFASGRGNFSAGGFNLVSTPRCGYCSRGAPFVKDHHHSKCPLVETMNKTRERLGYTKLEYKDQVWVRLDTKVAVDLSKVVEALGKRVGALELEVATLKKAPQVQGKKRKGAEAAQAAEASTSQAPPKKKAKKAKKGKKEEAPKPEAKAAKGKGKGKAKDS